MSHCICLRPFAYSPGSNNNHSPLIFYCRYIYVSDTPKRYAIFPPSDDSDSDDSGNEDSTRSAPSNGLSVAPTFRPSESTSPRYNSVFICDSIVDRSTAEQIWSPFIAILGKFKHLTDIVLEIETRIPPGLLAAIERHHPSCRLHLRKFRFKSLHDEVTDPDERALATSENLHSLSILYMYRDSDGVDDHNGAAALRTVRHAKNLKHVRMLGCRPASSYALYAARSRPLEEWKGFVPAIEEEDEENRDGEGWEKTKLESLSFLVYSNALTVEQLVKWEEIADFSQLKCLTFSTADEAFLRLVAAENKFPSLEELDITLRPSKQENLDGLEPAIEQFFDSLRPLTSLRLSGTVHRPLLDIIAQRHGATLQGLRLHPFTDSYHMSGPPLRITAPIVELLASKLPNLTSLNLTLKRSMGDRTETCCYEALGTLKKLRDLKLSLDCTNPSQWVLSQEEDWDDFDKTTHTHEGSMPKESNGHLKIAMVNSALDEDLVMQIWEAINEHRTKDTLPTLRIHTYGGSSFGNCHPGDLMDIVQHLSRSYKVTANPNVGGRVKIVELSKKSREKRDARLREHERAMVEKWGRKE